MKSKLIPAAGLVLLAAMLTPVANAAQVGGAVPAGGEPVQAQIHNHMKEKTGIAPAARGKALPQIAVAKPRHDHSKFHK